MAALLRVTGLCKSYGSRRAVDNVSFEVQAGQSVGLLGPNGAGKSTTVSMICGLLRPDAGQVTLDGMAVEPGPCAAKQRIGYVPQDLALYEQMTARANLMLFGALYGLRGAQLEERCAHALALVNLAERAGDKPATFSGGMKRRLNIAAALMHDPQLLVLDEPTVGVDPQSRNAIFDTLEQFKAMGRSLIYTSHYMEEVERLADHLVIIDHGKVLADETPQALFARLPVQAALRVALAGAPAPLLAGLREQAGVRAVRSDGAMVEVDLAGGEHAMGVMGWLDRQGCRPTQFATAQARLEDIFLTLTGRSLRD